MNKSAVSRGVAFTALLMSLAHAADADVVKIGVLAPLSGRAAADGQEFVNGAQLAVDELNASGGVAGHTFEVAVGDVGDASADAVVTAVERLLSDRKMGAVMTGYASGSNFEIEMMAEQEMIYLISGNSSQTRDIVSEDPKSFNTIWSLTPSFDSYDTEIVPVVQGLIDAGGISVPNKEVAIITSDIPYSKGIAEGMVDAFGEAGWTVTQNETLPAGEINDWRGFLSKVRQKPPAVLIDTDYISANAATFMSQFMEDPTDSLVFIQYAPSVPEFLELTRDKSTGVVYNLLGGVLDTPKNPRAKEVIDKYEDAYGSVPGTYGAALYEQVMLYADALKEVGDPEDRAAIGETIGASKKPTAMGMLSFDPETHLAVQGNDAIPLQFYQIVDGERVLFYPERYATGKFTTPPWMRK